MGQNKEVAVAFLLADQSPWQHDPRGTGRTTALGTQNSEVKQGKDEFRLI